MALLGDLLQGGVEVAGILDQIDRNRDLGDYADEQARAIGQAGAEASQFTPFGVTAGGTGAVQVDETGGLDYQLDPAQQAFMDQRMEQSGMLFDRAAGDITDLTNQRYGELTSAMQPGRDRERLALEARLHAQGRLGVGGAAYGGGNPEMFGLAQANREADLNAYNAARQFAQTQQQQDASLGGMFQQAGFAPQNQLVNMFTPGIETSRLQQAGQLGGASLNTQAGIAGLESKINAEKLASEAYSALYGQGAALAGQLGTAATSFFGGGGGGGGTDVIDDLIEGKIKEWF